MRILVLGATGSIGRSLVREFVRHRHEVVALSRSPESARRAADLGATPLAGDILAPESWLPQLPPLDGVVNVAATFDRSEEAVQSRLLDALLRVLETPAWRRTRLLYTGGCWLFGTAGGAVTTEESPFEPLPEFAWAVPQIERLRAHGRVDSIVIHPGMVYESTAGVFSRFYADATGRDAVRVVGAESVRWPLVHAHDLAQLYRLALERGAPHDCFLGTAVDGVAVGALARAFARRYGTPRAEPDVVAVNDVVSELGEWAQGYALDQVQSGARARRQLGWAPAHLDPLADILGGLA